MRTVISSFPAARAPGLSDAAATSAFRLLGFLIAVGVPTVFWTSALALVGHGFDLAIDERHLLGCALVVGAWCVVAASLVMSSRGES